MVIQYSVIIPAYNEENWLPQTLAGHQACGFPLWGYIAIKP